MSPTFGFEEALHNIKNKRAMARRGWNGRRIPGVTYDMYVVMVEGSKLAKTEPSLSMHTNEGKWQPGWVPSTADLFANDWEVVNVERPAEAIA
jgi:hypothetical protein